MFFEINKTVKDNFPINYKIKDIIFNFDLGWQVFNFKGVKIFFKGYILNNDSLENNLHYLIENNNHSLEGNFTAILCYNNHIVISHDINRGYPLWCEDCVITNLKNCENNIWADQFLKLDYNFNLDLCKVNLKEMRYDPLSYDTALKMIYDIIANKFESFLVIMNLI